MAPREVAVLPSAEFEPLVDRVNHDRSTPERETTEYDSDLEPGGGGVGAGGSGTSSSAATTYLHIFTAVASIGGFLFGFDTGVISGALPYIRDDILQARYAGDAAALAHWQELIVSSAIIAAGTGSVAGGWLADAVGRRAALLLADGLFAAGAVAMAAAGDQYWLMGGRALVGLGVGLASVTVPVYIAECAPPARRASLVTANVLAITTGQFVAYLADWGFSYAPGTWRWMLGVGALPALLQAAGLLLLPESPRWLAGRGRAAEAAEAARALHKLQPGSAAAAAAAAADLAGSGGGGGGGGDAGMGTAAAAASPTRRAARPSSSPPPPPPSTSTWRLLCSGTVVRELHVGVGLQILQQVAGINTVMYYLPTILALGGVQKQAALLLSLLPAATNSLGTLVGMRFIDRCGRRRLLLTSIAAVVLALAALGSAFLAAERHSPPVAPAAGGGTCPAAVAGGAAPADCMACLRLGCAFCGGGGGDPMAAGSCLALGQLQQQGQRQQQQQLPPQPAPPPPPMGCAAQLFLHGCPSRYTWPILACLVAFLAAFSPGLGPVPWAVNAEIYPLAVRGTATGIAATANWVSNWLVAQTFLTLTQRAGGSGAFFLYSAIACAGFLWAWAFLPETNGLSLEQVQQLFGGGEAGGGAGAGSAAGAGRSWALWREGKRRGSDDGGEEEAGLLAPPSAAAGAAAAAAAAGGGSNG